MIDDDLAGDDALDFLAHELVGTARDTHEIIEPARLGGGNADEGEGGVLHVVLSEAQDQLVSTDYQHEHTRVNGPACSHLLRRSLVTTA
jgi:hypothetical protein